MNAIALILALSLTSAPLDVDPDAECRARLERLEKALLVYRRVHGGALPATLAELHTENFVERISDFACAKSGVLIVKRSEIDGKCAFALDAATGGISEKVPHGSEKAAVTSKTTTTTNQPTSAAASPLVADEWLLRGEPGKAKAAIEEGVLVLALETTGGLSDAWRREEVSGDFLVELDYATSAKAAAGKRLHVAGFGLRIRPVAGATAVTFDCRTEGGKTAIAAEYFSQGVMPLTAPVASGSGSLALERRGSLFRFRYRVEGASKWTELGEFEAPLESAVQIGLTTYKVGSGEVRTSVSRFRLNPSRE